MSLLIFHKLAIILVYLIRGVENGAKRKGYQGKLKFQ